MSKESEILKEVLAEIKPSEIEIKEMKSYVKDFLSKLDKNLKKSKLNAKAFVGGSFAKNTLVREKRYDIDIFVRFDKKYKDSDISELTYKSLKEIKGISVIKIHGSRDYFRIDAKPEFYFEIIPVIAVTKPRDADNITDLSYYHVKYINKRIKSDKISNEILLAKAFCHANRVYGAESHIKGFSGYSLELLIYYYKNFLRFIKEIAKSKPNEKIVIDIEKHYKSRNQIFMDINSSKLESPIILIDPTFKQRNALATLSEETLENFRRVCKEFLRKPDIKFFRNKEIDFNKIKKIAENKDCEFLLLEVFTNMQEGAIAGSKLLKFYNYVAARISRSFNVKSRGFDYNDKKDAKYFFVLKNKGEQLRKGPPIDNKSAIEEFRKKHKDAFTKEGRIYSKERTNLKIREFIEDWKIRDSKIIKDMYITEIKIIDQD